MKNWFLLTFLLLGSALHAQNFVASSFHASDLLPRAYVFAGAAGMGSGYAPFAALGGAGVRIDSEHRLFGVNQGGQFGPELIVIGKRGALPPYFDRRFK
jgi:hypothetical protein